MDFFGTPWEDVTLGVVHDFLAGAGDEGIDWETKGTELPRPETVRKAVCGLANQGGGFFMIGPRRDSNDAPWRVEGVAFGEREAATWISDVLRNGGDRLRPEPSFDVKPFDVDGDSKLVIVMVDEIDQKPCMTGGRAALRLPGQTVWLEDPAQIRRLANDTDDRQAAENEAEAIALRAARILASEPLQDEVWEGRYLRFVLAAAPTMRPEDVAASIFPQTFLDALEQIAGQLPTEPLFHEFRRRRTLRAEVADRTSVVAKDYDGRQRWTVRVGWDGSVAVRLDALPQERETDARFISEVFGPMLVERSAEVAQEVLTRLGGSGRTHFVMIVGGERFSVLVEGIPFHFFDVPSLVRAIEAPIQIRSDADGSLSNADLERIAREFFRDCGAPIVEPEPAA